MTAIYSNSSDGSFSYVSTPRLRLTARGRRALAAIVALPLVAVALVLALNGGSATATDSSAPLTYISVEPGQTLWQLAEQLAPGVDPREVIADIVSLNDLSTQSLQVGQSLAIPVQYAH
jgi:hypothetical protein